MAADIFNTKDGDTVIKNGSITMTYDGRHYVTQNDDVSNQPTITEIETKYATRFK